LKVYGHAKDNAIAALGKIIKYHSDKIEIKTALDLWLSNLPIKYDKNEGYI